MPCVAIRYSTHLKVSPGRPKLEYCSTESQKEKKECLARKILPLRLDDLPSCAQRSRQGLIQRLECSVCSLELR